MSLIAASVLPVFLVMGLGALLKRWKFTNDVFLRTCDRLVYFIFFPILLFWQTGKPGPGAPVGAQWLFAPFFLILGGCLVGLLMVRVFRIAPRDAGSFTQCTYRVNTYVGMAIAFSAFGLEGSRVFAVMIGMTVPVINVLAVLGFLWFSEEEMDARERMRLIVKALFLNPLILGCLLGSAYGKFGIPFPAPLESTFAILAPITIPMALISIGGTISFANLRGELGLALGSSILKVALMPLLGYALLRLFGVEGVPFKVGMVFSALPTASTAHVLAAQLRGSVELSAEVIVVSTLLSFLSLSTVLALLQ